MLLPAPTRFVRSYVCSGNQIRSLSLSVCACVSSRVGCTHCQWRRAAAVTFRCGISPARSLPSIPIHLLPFEATMIAMGARPHTAAEVAARDIVDVWGHSILLLLAANPVPAALLTVPSVFQCALPFQMRPCWPRNGERHTKTPKRPSELLRRHCGCRCNNNNTNPTFRPPTWNHFLVARAQAELLFA